MRLGDAHPHPGDRVAPGQVVGDRRTQPLEGRDVATVAVNLAAVRRGAWMLRVHAVRPTRDALAVSAAIEAVA